MRAYYQYVKPFKKKIVCLIFLGDILHVIFTGPMDLLWRKEAGLSWDPRTTPWWRKPPSTSRIHLIQTKVLHRDGPNFWPFLIASIQPNIYFPISYIRPSLKTGYLLWSVPSLDVSALFYVILLRNWQFDKLEFFQ